MLTHPSFDGVSCPRVNCPACLEPLGSDFRCGACGERYRFDDEVLVLLTPADRREVTPTLDAFSKERSQGFVDEFEEYPHLPNPRASPLQDEWKARQRDLLLVEPLLKERGPLSILEIGPWKGWLSHHLVTWGHRLVTVDLFIDDVDGLKAVRHHHEKWYPVQARIDRLGIFPEQAFDCIIFNHSLQFTSDPVASYRQALASSRPGGLVVVLGGYKCADTSAVARRFEHRCDTFRRTWKVDMRLNDTKGFLDGADWSALRVLGMAPRAYPEIRNQARRLIHPVRPRSGYQVYSVQQVDGGAHRA